MDKIIQDAINNLNSELDNLGNDLIEYLKKDKNIIFDNLDTQSQALILTGFELGYRVGNNYKISIDIRGPHSDKPLDVKFSAIPLMFEDV